MSSSLDSASLRSRFRLRAPAVLTPAIRLNFIAEVHPIMPPHPALHGKHGQDGNRYEADSLIFNRRPGQNG